MIGVAHHGFEDVDVPAMHARLEEAALLIDHAIGNLLGHDIDVGLPRLLRDQADHLDEVARSTTGVEGEVIEQRLVDERGTAEILCPSQE